MKTIIRPKSEMKDSGIEWVGQIPKNWKSEKVKHSFYSTKTIVGNDVDEYERLALTLNGVIKRSKDAGAGLQPEKFEGYQILKKNELVFKLIDLANISTSRVGLSSYTGIVSPAYIVLHERNNIIPRYAEYYFMYMWINEVFNHLGGDGVRSALNAKDLLNILFLKVPYDEQQAIADYLDEKCSKIDEIIEEAKASIEEYNELKQAIIFEAVTKGLDKNVEMKDSGVEGMGCIPSTWKIVKFMKSNYVRARLGWKGLKAEEYVDEGYPFISAFNIINSFLNWDEVDHISPERYNESPEIMLSIGDIVLVKDGAGIGKCARIDEMPLGDATVNSSLSVITPNDILDFHYEYYYFMSPLFQNIIARLKNGMGVPHLTQQSMKDVFLPLPCINEQKRIADYLDEKVVELNDFISEKQSLISDLKVYKKSLIYEVVTGKRKVV